MVTNRRKGKYFKNDSPIIKYLSLVDYSLTDLSSKYSTAAEPDNQGGNVIHSKLHDPEELGSQVRRPPGFDELFSDPKLKSRIIMPGDFTSDWENMRNKKLINQEDSEDSLNIYEEELFRQNSTRSGSGGNEESDLPPERVASKSGNPASSTQQNPQAFRVVDAARSQAHGSSQASAQTNTQAAEKLASLAESRQEQYDELRAMQAFGNSADGGQARADFIPSVLGGQATPNQHSESHEQGHEISEPELRAAEEYKRLQQDRAEELQRLRSEAENAGFEAGYRLGEEKAILQVKEVAGQLFKTMDSLVHDLESLRGDILKSASENFLEIAQAIAEALIGHEMKANPESFKAVIDRALHDTLPGDQISIRVSPDMFESLGQLSSDKTFTDKLIADGSLADGAFVIDSKLNTMKADLKSITADTLKQMDLSILSEIEKAG